MDMDILDILIQFAALEPERRRAFMREIREMKREDEARPVPLDPDVWGAAFPSLKDTKGGEGE